MKFKFELQRILVIHPSKAIAVRSDTEYLLEFEGDVGQLDGNSVSIKVTADCGHILSPLHDGQPQFWIFNCSLDGCPFFSPLHICGKTALLHIKTEHHFAKVVGRTELIEYVIEFAN